MDDDADRAAQPRGRRRVHRRCDGLKGLPDAIAATWPLATIQTCVVHLVRNSLRYASKADWPITAGLKIDLHRPDRHRRRGAIR